MVTLHLCAFAYLMHHFHLVAAFWNILGGWALSFHPCVRRHTLDEGMGSVQSNLASCWRATVSACIALYEIYACIIPFTFSPLVCIPNVFFSRAQAQSPELHCCYVRISRSAKKFSPARRDLFFSSSICVTMLNTISTVLRSGPVCSTARDGLPDEATRMRCECRQYFPQ